MTSTRWQQTCRLFNELAELDQPARDERLSDIESTDPELRREVEALLAADAESTDRLAPIERGLTGVLRQHALLPRQPLPDPLRLAGRTLSHFRVVEPIGAGGMGMVYRAVDMRLEREVALKLPLIASQPDATARRRFLREARAAGALDHPNLCPVYEVGESDEGIPFLAMPLYEGEPLRSRLARDGALPVLEALTIACAVLAGLECAHAAGIVHRDLKPGNIMLLADGGVKILDFGLAKLADRGDASVGGLGTVGYMAPEQVRGEDVDTRADLWALGVVLYEMLTGARPFAGDDAIAVALAITKAGAPPSSRLRPEVAPALDDLVAKLLSKERSRRHADASAVAAELTRIEGELADAPRRSLLRRATRRLRATSQRVRVGVVLLAIGIGLAALMTPQLVAAITDDIPTANAAAYQYYLRGYQYEERKDFAVADTLYRRALAHDSTFALARARLAIVQIPYTLRTADSRLEEVRKEATLALRTDPELAEAHYAMGMYWQRRHDHQAALAEFALARRGMREHPVLHEAIGSSYRGLGRWEEAVSSYEQAQRLDPLYVDYAPQLALTYSRLRRYEDAVRAWDRFIALTPTSFIPVLIRGHVFVRLDGNSDSLAAAIARLPHGWDVNGMATWARICVAHLQRRPAEVLRALDGAAQPLSEDDLLYMPHSLLRAMALADLGDEASARTHFERAHALLQDSIAAHPTDPRLHIAFGFTLAGLERREAAIAAARQAMVLAPLSKNVVAGTAHMGSAAMIFAAVGAHDEALRLLDRLLGMPAGREVSVPLLRVDPAFDPLRGDARFEAMLQRYDRSGVR